MIIGAGQTFEWNHQNCLIFAKVSGLDNRASSKIQVTLSELSFWAKISAWIAGAVLQFSSAEMTNFCENFSAW